MYNPDIVSTILLMRIGIISDIHANLAAFKAVLADIEVCGGVTRVWCLGDVVGYGPDPHECVEILRETDHLCVAGNHDLAAIGKIGFEEFNPAAAESARWTASQLTSSDREYLEKLPLTIEEGEFTLAHGSPRDPIWEYVLTAASAQANFAAFKTRFCLVGHSHLPLIFIEAKDRDVQVRSFTNEIRLDSVWERLIVNPGGVGQPRDNDARASYALYDSDKKSITLRRVPYDIQTTQNRMARLGLPISLATRLSYGI